MSDQSSTEQETDQVQITAVANPRRVRWGTRNA